MSVEEFTKFENYPSCSIVQTLDYEDRCNYVKSSEACSSKKFYVNYIHLLYCVFEPRSVFTQCLAILTLMSLCLVVFSILGTTADKCFCPALKVLSKEMGMNEHLAGVTILAFGNGSPDLFTSLAGMQDSSRLLFSDMLGGAVYVATFVGGLVCISTPFQLQPTNVSRDVCFFILGALYIDYAIVSDGTVSLIESICIIGLYVVYLIIIISDQYLLKQSVKKMERRMRLRIRHTEASMARLGQMQAEAGIDLVSRSSRISINVELTRKMSYNALKPANLDLVQQFFESLRPYDREEWDNGGLGMRLLIAFKAPFTLGLLLLVPIVDYELDRHGWSKLLNSIQIMTMPVIILATFFGMKTFYNIPLVLLSLLLTIPLATGFFCMSRTDLPPRFHIILAIYSSIGSVFVIYSCASETVQILYILGIATYCSNAFLGCTLLAWGNSIGDVVSNIALARNGYPRMAFAACIGGPFFNSLLAMGGTFLYKTLDSPTNTAVVNQGTLGENCLVFLLVTLVTTLIWSVTTNFFARRSVGVYNVILYGLFFFYVVLSETEVIQTYAPETITGLI